MLKRNKNREPEIKPVKYKASAASRTFDVVNAVFMILFCITILIPFWDMIVRSFSRAEDISYMHINFFPKVWTLSAYKYCLQDAGIVPALLMSITRTVVGTVLHILVCCLAAYTMTRSEMPFRGLITGILLVPMFVSAGMIPDYLNIKRLGLIDNFWVYVLPSAFSIFDCIIIRNYFFSIDKGMEESASIDGASYFTIFAKIIMPLSKPVVATVALWQMVGQWNAWFDNMVYCRGNKNLTTLQYMLRRMLDSMSQKSGASYEMEAIGEKVDMNPDTVKAATTIIVVLPIIIVYPFVQKYFVKGIMVGAVKG